MSAFVRKSPNSFIMMNTQRIDSEPKYIFRTKLAHEALFLHCTTRNCFTSNSHPPTYDIYSFSQKHSHTTSVEWIGLRSRERERDRVVHQFDAVIVNRLLCIHTQPFNRHLSKTRKTTIISSCT